MKRWSGKACKDLTGFIGYVLSEEGHLGYQELF